MHEPSRKRSQSQSLQFCLPCNDLESNLHSCVCRRYLMHKLYNTSISFYIDINTMHKEEIL